ncbi:hypothetical protein M422DRAFT_262236 [Sphaerobolus stellatus SS14]|uniref:Unplaced genomic scaffold SPHSTscaffold_113, whole genome shotgun sequence n=1 Tax=Sphaerobolus stellatus (strain SS14) TaxID=990650 RepID=A0A0C9UKT3_SPHS4|nr:hypothetical protein M422DRAFT_262236 [Sphaerobolus stellatus SS14]
MDNKQSTPMQVDLSTNTMGAIQASKTDPSIEWVIESVPGFIAIKHKMELARYQDNYYRLLEDHNTLKEDLQAVERKADKHRQLQEQKYEVEDNSANKELILKNKHLKEELKYYVGRTQYALYGKDECWDIPIHPPPKPAHPVGTKLRNDPKVIPKAGIPAIGGLQPHFRTQKRIITDPPTSITGVLPKLLGKVRAECWDQPALRGASEWIMDHDVHDLKMQRLYIEGKALQPHKWSPDHTVAMFHIDEYTRSLPDLHTNLEVHASDPLWMTDVIQSFNKNPSGIPQNLHTEGLYININDADIWY